MRKKKINPTTKKKYDFSDADLKLKHSYEKKLKKKIPDEEFYEYIQEARKLVQDVIKAVKKWKKEKPEEVERFTKFVDKLEKESKIKKLKKKEPKIKEFNIAKLKNYLSPYLKKEGYIKLEFSKPEIEKDVIIKFTVQDTKDKRDKYDSRIILQKTIKQKLSKTNWHLMSEGVNYRLGILSGRLKGHEESKFEVKYG